MTNTPALPIRQEKSADKSSATLMLSDLPFIFISGGFIGTVYEFLLTLLTTGQLEDRTGSVLTPFNYVYGTGAVIMILVLYRMKDPLKIYFAGCFLGGAVEFGISFLQENIFGTLSWDYSDKFLNIGGRTTVPYMLIWGALCLIAVKFFFPKLLGLIHRIPEKKRKVIALCIVCLMCADMAITWTATMRFSQRMAGILPQNGLAGLFDRVFHDKYMLTHFPNMIIQ